MHTRFVALVPVKSPGLAKTRLDLRDEERRSLAVAFALDTVDAVLATPHVERCVVVTSDAGLQALARRRGCDVSADAGDLNASLRAASSGHQGLLVALCADLPALRPDDLADALAAVGAPAVGRSWFVADTEGTGTTAYVASDSAFDPQFGDGSAARHLAAGAHEISGALPTLRRDVDTVADLVGLAELGILGLHTTAALEGISLPLRG